MEKPHRIPHKIGDSGRSMSKKCFQCLAFPQKNADESPTFPSNSGRTKSPPFPHFFQRARWVRAAGGSIEERQNESDTLEVPVASKTCRPWEKPWGNHGRNMGKPWEKPWEKPCGRMDLRTYVFGTSMGKSCFWTSKTDEKNH